MNDNRVEPLTVTHLRSQIRRRASMAVLSRIAGGEVEFWRLDATYRLLKPKPRPDLPVDTLPAPPIVVPVALPRDAVITFRQRVLLGLVAEAALEGEIVEMLDRLSRLLGCDRLIVERDLQHLRNRSLIRIAASRSGGRFYRRVELLGKRPVAAVAPPWSGAMNISGVGAVDG